MSLKRLTTVERLAALEVQMDVMKTQLDDLNSKLDDLIALRNRGVGAFWLASLLFGSGIVGFVALVTGWFRH